jgi:hypothetical protein
MAKITHRHALRRNTNKHGLDIMSLESMYIHVVDLRTPNKNALSEYKKKQNKKKQNKTKHHFAHDIIEHLKFQIEWKDMVLGLSQTFRILSCTSISSHFSAKGLAQLALGKLNL